MTTAGTRHRGPHPADRVLFADAAVPVLRAAVDDLSWLLERGYGEVAALKLVGDRHGLRERQRRAVLRSACGPSACALRRSRALEPAALAGCTVAVDGLNCIITLEAALSGGLVLRGRDRAHRDLSSIHGTYRRVVETQAAVTAVAELFREHGVASARWLLDRPVSNSGRLKALIAASAPPGMEWRVELAYNPDRELVASSCVIASSDSWVLDRADAWIDVPGAVIARGAYPAWIVDLGVPGVANRQAP